MTIKKTAIACLLLLGSIQMSTAQDLLEILNKEQKSITNYVPPAFKMTRVAFGHSTEVRSKGVLELFTATRFWNLPGDRSQSFAADKITTRIALEYGVSDRLSFGIGGTTFDGLFDSYFKYKLWRQQKGEKSMPFNVALLQTGSYNSSSGSIYSGLSGDFSERLAFTSQVLVSRRMSSKFSLQLAPTFVHKPLGVSNQDNKNFFALGFGARYKLGPHLALVSEYYRTFNPIDSFDTYDPFAIGVNWELGDILIQLMLTNTRNMVEDTFITQTRNNFNFKDPNLHFGFNATYVFHLSNKLKNK
ncbi:DUF5777 family beta-barrel protein [Winogradskyella haliclonae]|uniref:DUF5777 domain-containing protein n=1 Tax=Winogradskyella haliclonae TaxID=2048558 RepID=A0ABQ2BXY7_9FLAO|nr:DUF5777 family beta-barrel protein [Winogradskyella haliclonae]GGI56427.1 hypothetical protein GCM10011444_07360 [Winogradskyella haliclonae]